jgi:hypothetical protein
MLENQPTQYKLNLKIDEHDTEIKDHFNGIIDVSMCV